MLRVPIEQAQPGMVLGMGVMHPRRKGTTLLRAGYDLTDLAIKQLAEQDVRDLWIRYPSLEFIARHVSPEVESGRSEVASLMGRALDSISREGGGRMDYSKYTNAVSGLVAGLLHAPEANVLVQEVGGAGDAMARHSSDVTYLSLLMGLKLDWYLVRERKRMSPDRAKDVFNLGVAAMLHDIGMIDLDAQTLDQWQETLDERNPKWRRHVLTGYERLKEEIDAPAAAAVLHHHQHWDGSGFPAREVTPGVREGLRGSQIHIFARIITAADLFDRLRYPPGTTQRLPVVRAQRKLLETPYCDWIDPVVLRALFVVAPAFTIGTIAELSDGRKVVVTSLNEAQPCRPVVHTLDDDAFGGADAAAAESEGERIDLSEHPGLTIARSDGEDVSDDVFTLPGDWDAVLKEGAVGGLVLHGGSDDADASKRLKAAS